MHVGKEEDAWEEINITIDSGAVDTVGPKGVGSGYPIQQTEASNRGMFYRAANATGTPRKDRKLEWARR